MNEEYASLLKDLKKIESELVELREFVKESVETEETANELEKTEETANELEKTEETANELEKTEETVNELEKTEETENQLKKTEETENQLDEWEGIARSFVETEPGETGSELEAPKETLLTWRIESAHLCWQKNGEELISPTFTIDWLNKSSWNLCLYPRGIQGVDDYASYCIVQVKKSDTEENVDAKFELYFLAADGSKVLPKNPEGFLSMRKNIILGYSRFFRWLTLMDDDECHYLPNETLTLCCRIWEEYDSSSAERKEPVKLKAFARTRIRKEEIFQQMPIFLKESRDKKIGELRPILQDPIVKFVANCHGASKENRLTICINIDEESKEKIKSALFELVLVNEDKKTLFWKSKYTWDDILESGKIELSSQGSKIAKGYVPRETFSEKNLYLACRFSFTTGSITQNIEMSDYGNNLDNFFEQRLSNSNNMQQEQPGQTLSDALKSLFHDPLFYDVIIKGKNSEFKVHDMIVSPRSEVFKKQLSERNMETNVVNISEDDDTLQRVLYFLYTDKILDMHWEIAKRMYKAAVKYKIELLKEKCRTYIRKNFSVSNITDIMILIKGIKDEELKEHVKYFISQNDVFNSIEWSIFSKSHPALAADYMLSNYKMIE